MSSKVSKSRVGHAIHIVPYDGVGGVETAVRSMRSGLNGSILFEKCYLARKSMVAASDFEYHGRKYSENNVNAYLAAISWILKRKPDVVIASLWRSCLVTIVLKILRPKTRVVTFLHLDRSAHLVDRIVSFVAMAMSNEVWADSAATLKGRVPDWLQSRGHVISMRTPLGDFDRKRLPEPKFVFWGRLHRQKGLFHAIQLFAKIKKRFPGACFDIIGPDAGQRALLEKEVASLTLGDSVRFLGAMPQHEALEVGNKSCFYLQTSKNEGLAMSVSEAMQLGLVPVVTPVGEIARYCMSGINAIIVNSDEDAVSDVACLLGSRQAYLSFSRAAMRTANARPMYSFDVLAGVNRLIEGRH